VLNEADLWPLSFPKWKILLGKLDIPATNKVTFNNFLSKSVKNNSGDAHADGDN
jgi:hypothetical protein